MDIQIVEMNCAVLG